MTIPRHTLVLTGPWILYDGTCGICQGGELRFGPMLRRRGFRLAPLQGEIARTLVGGPHEEMKVVTHSGAVLGGAPAVAWICRQIRWARPVAWLWAVPALRPMFHRVYRCVADHRHLVPAKACPLGEEGADA